MKISKFAIYLFVFLYSKNIYSQTAGVSASKLAVINAETVTKNQIEFEPSFNFLISKSDTSKTSESDFCFRFTYGISSKTEIGIFVPVNINTVNWGIKHNFFSGKKFMSSVIAGFQNNLDFSNPEKTNNNYFFRAYSAGTASTYNFNEKLSLDFDIQIENHFHYYKRDLHLFVNTEAGYYISKGLQIVSGVQYGNSPVFHIHGNSFIINAGFTSEKAEDFILVLNFPYKLKNNETENALGFSLALTILLK